MIIDRVRDFNEKEFIILEAGGHGSVVNKAAEIMNVFNKLIFRL